MFLTAVLSAVLWGVSLWQGAKLKPYAEDFQIRYHAGVVSEEVLTAMRDEKAYSGKKRRLEAAAWNVEYGVEVKNPVLDFKQNAVCIIVDGSMSQVVKDRLIAGNYGFADDEDGCIISSKTAWELFGSTDVTGQWIAVKGKSFLVRGVTAGSVPMVMVPAKRLKVKAFSNVSLSSADSQGLAGAAQEVMMRFGFPGEEVRIDGSFFWAAVRLACTLPCWAVFFCACMAFKGGGRGKRREAGRKQTLRRASFVALAAGCTAVLFWYGVRFPEEFIPSLWSDFSFYTQKISQVNKNLLEIAMLPLSPWDVEVKRAFTASLLCPAGAAVLITITGSLLISLKKER